MSAVAQVGNQRGLVDLLNKLLADAESGKIKGVVVLSNDADGYRRWSAGHWTPQDALYLFEMWKHAVLFGDHGGN